MKKTTMLMVIIITSILLIGCNSKEEYESYAVVHYETNFMGETTGRIIFGTKYSDGQSSTVYHYNKKNNSIQLQPYKQGNTIMNVNASWQKVESIETEGFKKVFYNNSETHVSNYELINNDDIEVFKITIHNDFGSMIAIEEIFVINILDITAFEFNYKVEELE